MQEIRYDVSLWGEMDSYLFKEGTHTHIYEILGSHRVSKNQLDGVYFAVWAPNAKSVSVIGDFNNYRVGIHPLKLRGDGSGVWEGFIPNLLKDSLINTTLLHLMIELLRRVTPRIYV